MASAAYIPRNNENALESSNWRFRCDFCPKIFYMEDSFNEHTLKHFEKKNCLNCKKFLIRIGSKWYEPHIDDLQIDETEQKVEFIDSMVKVKVENCEDITEINDPNEDDTSSHNDVKSVLFDVPIIPVVRSIQLDEHRTKVRHKLYRKPMKKDPKNSTKSPEAGLPRKRKVSRIKCRICDRLIQKHNFENHLQKAHVPSVIMSKEKKEKIDCETCGKSFANSQNLKIHQMIHSGTKRFVCTYCGKSFRQLYHLTEHMNAHTGNKPYECKECKKCFFRLVTLRTHERIHSGKKPYKCSIDGCDKAYAHSIDLKRHKFSAHGIYTKKHICSFCDKVFPENKLLKKHLDSHSTGNIR